MLTPKIAIIGAGNMGGSLIGGLLKHGQPADQIIATNLDKTKLEKLQNEFSVQISTDNKKACEQAAVVIIAVKPQAFVHTASQLSPFIQKNKPLVLSIAAGITMAQIEQLLGNNIPIVRCMPNTPAMYGLGASALFANAAVTLSQRTLATQILEAVGCVVWLQNECDMDIVTGLSGSGPAYFFLVMEALHAAATELGLEPEAARILTLQTALGASQMAKMSNHSLADLRKQVTSPGGTTEKAISVLEENNIRDLFKKALRAAKERAAELGHQLGEK